MSGQLPGDMPPPSETPLEPTVITDRDHRRALEAHPTNELGQAFAGVFDRFGSEVMLSANGRFESVTLDADHPRLGLGMRLHIVRPSGGEIDDDFGSDSIAMIPVVSVDISIPTERAHGRTTQGKLASAAIDQEVKIDMINDEPVKGFVISSDAIDTDTTQLAPSEPIETLDEVPVIHIDLGVMSTIEEAPEYGLASVEDFKREHPDVVSRYQSALEAFKINHDQSLLPVIEEGDNSFVKWQMENERLLLADAAVNRTTSGRLGDDQSVQNARTILTEMIERIGDQRLAAQLNPNEYFSTSTEPPVSGEIWMGDEVAHREIAGPFERILVDFFRNGNLRSVEKPDPQLGAQAQLPE